MPLSPFKQMQKAVDIVNTSPHPTSKVAATVFGIDAAGKEYSVSHTNYWPDAILNAIGKDIRIGNASGTIHAETACILAADFTEGAGICITDPFCPNCAKNIAEAGIKTIYIDHKGFHKDFASRRGSHFDSMSMQICAKAGINVYEIWRKEEKLVPILEIPVNYDPPNENPIEIEAFSKPIDQFREMIKEKTEQITKHKFAVMLVTDDKSHIYMMTARAHPAIGYTSDEDAEELSHPPESKYSFIQEPVNRLLMAAPRFGMKIMDGYLFCSQIPTSREQVNMVGAGLSSLYIEDKSKARDDDALRAMNQLQTAGIIMFRGYL